ncbi:MAG: bifunctional 23S rRNA (guanine(2069)-N(7))-methyltransferase RlmK/23S rRNA (guanine(2445)-N(2))-methyltransferase RlmL [Desulfobulbaceae bacterium]|nr:bifunctional 23S rRNA (guanine(2069)-N(7))-methyltransferase RlmK/23S rRNA (guanine(2445)-N(2))-methyltransferase RlmL [Desulfobulbaceae bacterium]
MSPAVRSQTRTRKSKPLLFTATCATGLEQLVSEEIAACGGQNIQVKPGAVNWNSSTLESGYRACLWSRFASRILLELARFDAPDTDAVYGHTDKVLWDEHLSVKKTFAVHSTLVNAALPHSQFAALRVKDAIVDQFRRRFGKRPDVNTLNPDIRLNLHVEGTGASLALDLSGDSLHRRGYRVATGEAPLKETLAAALVRFSGWLEQVEEEPVLLDPMCGGGTLLIEAALMLADSAPGLQRKRFGFMGWNKHDHKLWEFLIAEALEREAAGEPKEWPQFIGYDADPRAVAAARKNVIAAGLRDVIVIRHRQLARLRNPGPAGCILTNPPYGERLSEKEAVRYLYRSLGRSYRNYFFGWRFAFFTANPEFADVPAVVWQKEYQLYNGPLKCRLLIGRESRPAPSEPSWAQWQPQPLPSGSPGEDFANRLLKNFAALAEWIKREGIHCFRLYDADMPEYNLAVDCYGEWIQVQEYAAPASVDAAKAEERLQLALAVLREVMAVPHSRLFIKTRKRQKGSTQYQKKTTARGQLHEVREGEGRFLVNFTDYLDTGLFLDHRPIRSCIQELAKGVTFLNLYGYTGAATVFAALGGASSTVTVDASETYLARANANLALNGFGGPLHQLIEADCMQWLKTNQERFGLIFVDPPTFSNTRGSKDSFDVQRDHVALLRLAMQRLSRGGLLIFSNNFRKFVLDESLAAEFTVEEISADTIPPDFSRNQRIHRCWELRHKTDSDQ